ncbi:MAG TPA: ABC transporter permease [Bacteroidales bacterium]|nr:ABC transporter permease [Bacteroidales bacterium]
MKLEFFIAKRIIAKNKANFSRPIVRIAVLSIALGVAVMIVSVAIVTGFQKEIRNKVIGFGGHIVISNYDENVSMESSPVSINQKFYPSLSQEEGIDHIQVYATKAGIIKTDEEIQGVVLKGVGSDFDWSFFNDKIIKGKSFTVSDTGKTNDILVSEYVASQLKLDTGQSLLMYFINKEQVQPSVRKFRISGIYNTGLEEFDKIYVIGDIHHIQRLNNWDSTQVGGFEVMIKNFKDLDKITESVYNQIDYNLNCTNVKQQYPQIFDWLDFQDVNVTIIIVMMVIVAAINMISALLILIIEKTTLIGVLKALGMRNWSIRKIFLYNASYLIIRGLIWGNIIALVFCFVQKFFGIIKLDPASYYVREVPINLDVLNMLLINFGTIAVCVFVLVIPTYVVTRISPVRAIRFS